MSAINTAELRHELLNGGITCIQTLGLLEAIDAQATEIEQLSARCNTMWDGYQHDKAEINRLKNELGEANEYGEAMHDKVERLTSELQKYKDALTMPGGHVTTPEGIAKLLEKTGKLCADNATLRTRCATLEAWRASALASMREIVDGVFTANAYPTVDLHTENPRYQYFVYLHEGEFARFRKFVDDQAQPNEGSNTNA